AVDVAMGGDAGAAASDGVAVDDDIVGVIDGNAGEVGGDVARAAVGRAGDVIVDDGDAGSAALPDEDARRAVIVRTIVAELGDVVAEHRAGGAEAENDA